MHDSELVMQPRPNVLRVDEVGVKETGAGLPPNRPVGDVQTTGAKLLAQRSKELIGAPVGRRPEAIHHREVRMTKGISHSDRRNSP